MGFSIHEAFPYRFLGFSVDVRGLSVDQGFSGSFPYFGFPWNYRCNVSNLRVRSRHHRAEALSVTFPRQLKLWVFTFFFTVFYGFFFLWFFMGGFAWIFSVQSLGKATETLNQQVYGRITGFYG